MFQRAEPLAPPSLTFEVDQRTTAWGEGPDPVREAQAREVAKKVVAQNVDAIAICFLHSYQDPADEIRMRDILRALDPTKFITMSHEIVRKSGEYERTSTTVLNAYIGPRTEQIRVRSREPAGEGRLRRQASDHAVEWRPDVGGLRQACAGGDDGVGAGRRRHRLGADQRQSGLREFHCVRHGRHHRQDQPGARQRAVGRRRAIISAAMRTAIRR